MTDEWLTVPDMAREMCGKISADQLRTFCRTGRIAGAINKGNADRAFFVVSRASFEAFKKTGAAILPKADRPAVGQHRDRSPRNLVGL